MTDQLHPARISNGFAVTAQSTSSMSKRVYGSCAHLSSGVGNPSSTLESDLRCATRCPANAAIRSDVGPLCASCDAKCFSTSAVTSPNVTSFRRNVAGLLSHVTPANAVAAALEDGGPIDGCGNTGSACASRVEGARRMRVAGNRVLKSDSFCNTYGRGQGRCDV